MKKQEATRDPRVDPRPGDVLSKKYQGRLLEVRERIEREVDEVFDTRTGNRRVVYFGDHGCSPDISINSWRKWAATARIVKVADA